MEDVLTEKTLLIDDQKDIPAHRTARNFHDGLAALQEDSWDLLLLDHDLGHFENGREFTGYDVLLWLKENPQHLPKRIQVVSLNPVGRNRMVDFIKRHLLTDEN